MQKRAFFWGELTTEDFRDLAPERTIALLPVAAVEQHGPHLPVLTDTVIADGMLAVLRRRLPDDLAVLALPTQAYGKSNEHLLSPGTVTLSAPTLLAALIEIGDSVARAGLRKLVLMNSHGGNADILGIVARELRVRHGMLCVATHWRRFGLPAGVYDAIEDRHGIHAGDIETSLMLCLRPDLVRMDKVQNFVSGAEAMEQQFTQLRAVGAHGFGWIVQDLNTQGAVGNASVATAAKGEATAEHQVQGASPCSTTWPHSLWIACTRPMPTPFADISWPDLGPDGGSYRLANARVPACLLTGDTATELTAGADAEGVVRANLMVSEGRIAAIEPAESPTNDTGRRIDLGGRQVWPTLIDVHTHLDKGHTVERAPNTDGTFHNARLAAIADRPARTHEDLIRRMGFGLRCAYAHGVSAIRTHLDTYPDSAERTWEAFAEIRAAWKGRVELQAVSLCPIDLIQDAYGDHIAALVARSGGVLGGVTRPSVGDHGAPPADIDAKLDRLFLLASRHNLDIDLHVDESGDPAAATLPHVARAALRHDYRGRVTCGHCCSLAVQPEDEALRTLDLLAEAQVAVVSLPTVNMYLQDRVGARTPRWRGVTLIHEMRRRNIAVAVAGDNCRDSFYAYGDHDMVDTFRQAVRILHLDHPLAGAPALVGQGPAAIARLAGHGQMAIGAPARLIVFNARTLNELISRPQSDRVVIHGGRRLSDSAPDHSELWTLD